MIVINAVIGGFSGEYLKWLAHATLRLQVSDYNFVDSLGQNKAVYAPITFEEIVIVVIRTAIAQTFTLPVKNLSEGVWGEPKVLESQEFHSGKKYLMNVWKWKLFVLKIVVARQKHLS